METSTTCGQVQRPEKILVVDDNPEILEATARALEKKGYQILRGLSGAQGLEGARHHVPDLILVNRWVGDMAGLDLCRTVKSDPQLANCLVVIATTVKTHVQDQVDGIAAGVDGYLTRPLGDQELVVRVEAFLRLARPGPNLRKQAEVLLGELRQRKSPGQSLEEASALEALLHNLDVYQVELEMQNSDLRLSQQQLEAAKDRYYGLYHNAPVGYLALDDRGMIHLPNATLAEMLGVDIAQLNEKPFVDFVVAEDKSLFWGRFRAFFRESRGKSMHLRLVTHTGEERHVALSGARKCRPPTETGVFHDGQVVLVTLTDITERKRLEAQAAQTDRLATLGTLAAGVAHEINNPLAYVLHNLEALSEELSPLLKVLRGKEEQGRGSVGGSAHRQPSGPPDQPGRSPFHPALLDRVQDYFEQALDGTRRIKKIAQGLNVFSRVEKDHSEPVEVKRVAEVALNMVGNEVKYRARLNVDLGETPRVMASEGRLAQVIVNLLVNAAHSLAEGEMNRNEIRLRSWSEANYVYVAVSDNGKGIPKQDLDRVFDPFFSTKPQGSGAGLGLAISKRIIEGFRGTLTVQSEEGKGTCFTFRLPVVPQGVTAAAGPAVKRDGPRRRGRLLIVDDEAPIRKAMARVLRAHDTIAAASGAEARDILRQDQGFDLILCDMMMNDLSGLDLHRWLVQAFPALAQKLIFVTGGAFTASAREYLDGIDNPTVEKPIDMSTLRRLVDAALEE